MKLSRTYSLILLICLGLISSCKKNKNEDPEPTPTFGDITGRVNLYDEGITAIDNSGMTVTVEGVTPTITATTDSEGSFTLSNVSFGTYTLVYEKSGFGTFKNVEIEHTNTNTIITLAKSLGQSSTTQITNLSSTTSNNTVTVATEMTPSASISNTRYLRYFFSTNANVSNENYEAVMEALVAQIDPYNLNLTSDSFTELGFTSGQTVYVRCYGESFWSNQYDDDDLGRTIFPNLNQTTTNAVSFVVP